MVLHRRIIGLITFMFLTTALPPPSHGRAQEKPDRVGHQVELMKSSDARVRRRVAIQLGLMETQAKQVVPMLIELLKDAEPDVRSSAANSLGRMKTEAKQVVPALIEVLKDAEPDVRSSAANSLGRMETEAKQVVPVLIEVLKDAEPSVRSSAAKALAMETEAKQVVPALIEVLKDAEPSVRSSAANALGAMETEAKQVVPALIEVLKDAEPDVRSSAAWALWSMNTEAKQVVPVLIEVLKDAEPDVRGAAAEALGQIETEDKQVLPALIEVLKDPEPDVRRSAAFALSSVANRLFDATSRSELQQLREAHRILLADPNLKDQFADNVRRAIDYLESLWWLKLNDAIEKLIQDHPYLSIAIIVYLLLQLGWLVLFWRQPLLLLKVVTSLGRVGEKIKIPKLDIPLPLRSLLVLPVFYYRPRLLNAWVRHYLNTAKNNFANKHTVSQRKVYVALSASINGEAHAKLSATVFQPLFNNSKIAVLVTGEGGTGKTSLACQVAIWAMQTDKEQRLGKNLMLPVLVENNLEPRADSKDVLVEAVHGLLRDSIGETEPIFEELFIQLLRKRRVLVIVDSLSELNETTRKSVRPMHKDFPIGALVVTSRLDEGLGGATKTTIRPIRLRSNGLSAFLHDYLSQCGKRALFEDEEFFDGCRRLSQIVGGREITVLIAKMFAEQMIASKEPTSEREPPRNLPDLMQGYIKILNDQLKTDKLETRRVQRASRLIAAKCLERTYRPAPTKVSEVFNALGVDADPKALLEYLENRLQIIQTTGAYGDEIRFSLDPLAEYLTGLYLVETYRDRAERWRDFVDYARNQPGAPEAIKGFLLAVRDCCIEKGNEYRVPESVKDELAQLSGLDDASSATVIARPA